MYILDKMGYSYRDPQIALRSTNFKLAWHMYL